MSSILISSQSMVLVTAMAAFSGTFILIVFRHHKTLPRPCLHSSSVSEGKRRKKKKKSNKRVHFADDVVEPRGDGAEFRNRHRKFIARSNSYSNKSQERIMGMPANRVALYNGMLRDRSGQRMGYW